MWLFALLVLIPFIEIALFIQVGGWIGLWPTLGLIILTTLVGTAIVRNQGANALIEVQRSFNELRDPARPMAHGAMIMFAGVLLLMPGFFTDTIGLLLLIPPVRDVVMRRVGKRISTSASARHVRRGSVGSRDPHPGSGVIDGEYVVEDEPVHPRPSPPDLETTERPGRKPSGWTNH